MVGQLRPKSQRSTELVGLMVGFQGRWGLTVGREVGVEDLAPLMEVVVGHGEEVQLGERECWTSGTGRRISGKEGEEVGAGEK